MTLPRIDMARRGGFAETEIRDKGYEEDKSDEGVEVHAEDRPELPLSMVLVVRG